MDRGSDLDGVTFSPNVHVHYTWRFVKQVVVDRGLFDAAFLQLRRNRADFILEEHEVSHGCDHVLASLFEADPGTEGQRWLDLDTAKGDVQIAARHAHLVDLAWLESSGLSQGFRNPGPVDWR